MKYFWPCLMFGLISSCSSNRHIPVIPPKVVEQKPLRLFEVASFNGAQVTGVTASKDGRIFASFPRWRSGVPFSVVEVFPDGTSRPYPNVSWNMYEGKPQPMKFTCVQSVIAQGDSLFVLDPSSPMMSGVIGKAKVFEFDLKTNELKRSWTFEKSVAPKEAYLNDLRIDDEAQKIYITDSGLGGIVVLDMATGKSWRSLDKDKSTKAESVVLSIDDKNFLMNGRAPKIHSDGIAFSPENKKLYYHALTAYHLYSIPTEALTEKNISQASDSVQDLGATPAPDGMILDKKGNLYMADLEKHSIVYRTPIGEMKTLVQDPNLNWPDTLTIEGSNLLFTDSNLGKVAPGASAEGVEFKIYKVALPETI